MAGKGPADVLNGVGSRRAVGFRRRPVKFRNRVESMQTTRA